MYSIEMGCSIKFFIDSWSYRANNYITFILFVDSNSRPNALNDEYVCDLVKKIALGYILSLQTG